MQIKLKNTWLASYTEHNTGLTRYLLLNLAYRSIDMVKKGYDIL